MDPGLCLIASLFASFTFPFRCRSLLLTTSPMTWQRINSTRTFSKGLIICQQSTVREERFVQKNSCIDAINFTSLYWATLQLSNQRRERERDKVFFLKNEFFFIFSFKRLKKKFPASRILASKTRHNFHLEPNQDVSAAKCRFLKTSFTSSSRQSVASFK